jgi:hypothetical protein
MTPYTFAASGRNWTTLIVVACVWCGLGALVVGIDMAPWLAGIIVLFTLPALYDLFSARTSGLSLDDTTLSWFAGQTSGDVRLAKIKLIRFDTRLDLSVRLTIVPHVGSKVKVPFEATPPHRAFEEELIARGIKTERHHFGFI